MIRASYYRMKAEGGERYRLWLERSRLRCAARRALKPKGRPGRVPCTDPVVLEQRRERERELERLRSKLRKEKKRAEREALIVAGLLVRKKPGRRSTGLPPKKMPWKTMAVARARQRGRKIGLEATITVADIFWPTHCPVLGIKLYYPDRQGENTNPHRPDRASLDRWDNTKGYVPGNVYVISFRANTLKNNATAAELQAVASYARKRPTFDAPRLPLELVASSVRAA